jgi:hypothetical protein
MAHKDRDQRGGDILGLGGAAAPLPHSGSTAAFSSSESSQARRRRRMSDGADELTPGTGDEHQGGAGATGIDMGGGGEGTDIE